MASRFRRYPEIRLVFLFGSFVKERARSDSDLDVAFWLEPWLGNAGFDTTGRLVTACAGFFPSHLIDVVILNAASPVLRVQVLKTGRLLYERAEGDCKRFMMKTGREYQDGAYRRETAYGYRLARIRKGVTDGGPGDILAAARRVAGLFGEIKRV